MPKTAQITRETIIDAAFDLVRRSGVEALSTRAVAKRLGCSTMPIYTVLKAKSGLEEPLTRKAFDLLLDYQTTPRTGDPFLDMGAGYVIFAKREKHLFRLITAETHVRRHRRFNDAHFRQLIGKLAAYPVLQGLSDSEVYRFFNQGWAYSHGLAHLVNTGYSELNDEQICRLLVYTGRRYIHGFQALRDPQP